MEKDRTESLFAKALGMKPGPERDAFLDEVCRGRAELRGSLESLLQAHEEAGGFLDTAEAGAGGPGVGIGDDAAKHARQFLRELAEGRAPLATTLLAGRSAGERREFCERIEAGCRARTWEEPRRASKGVEGEDVWPHIPGYVIEGRLGGGGLGRVYAARDEKLGRRVAIKVLRAATDRGVRQRILAEARKAAALDHPGVVTVFTVLDETDPPALVMELVEGYPLDRFAERLTFEQKAGLLREVARGLAAAHASGMIHRDLKPENVVVGPEMQPRILDFGLALSLEEAARVGGGFEGTPLYASPEQVRGQSLTPASDVFSLGSLMFKVLTGSAPFGGGTIAEVFEAIATTRPPFLRDVAVGVPEDLQALVLACLAWDPADRPTAATVVVELGRYLAGEPVRLRPRLYEDVLRQRVSDHAREVASWESQGIISRDEKDQLQLMHRRLLADEDHWIIDARRLTAIQTGLYTSTWIVVVASVLWVWQVRETVGAPWGWLWPLWATGVLLGVGAYAERRRETLAAASFLAAGGLSLAPTLLAILRELGWWEGGREGVTSLLGSAFSNAQCFVACLGAWGISLVGLGRLRMTGFAWTSVVLGVAAYVSGLMVYGWLDWPLYRQGWTCLPLVALEWVALGFEQRGRVRWSFPYHLVALAALVGGLDVMAYDGPEGGGWGVGVAGSFWTEDRVRALGFAGNGFLFLALMFLAERSRSLDLRRGARVLEFLALVHTEGALYANAQAHRGSAHVGIDVALYLGAALIFLGVGAWRARWRLLVGALAGLAMGSYLLVDLGLVARTPFILALGCSGLLAAGGLFLRLLVLSEDRRDRGRGKRAGKDPGPLADRRM